MLGWVWWLLSWLFWIVWFGMKLILCCVLFLIVILFKHQGAILYQRHQPSKKRQIVYNPDVRVKDPTFYGIEYEDYFIETSDQVRIHCWFLKQKSLKKEDVATIVVFHGNAGNIGYRLPNVHLMFDRLKCHILLVEYRGYGNSEGIPTQWGLSLDARAALMHLKNRDDINHDLIFIFGRSLGGAVAIELARQVSEGEIDGCFALTTDRRQRLKERKEKEKEEEDLVIVEVNDEKTDDEPLLSRQDHLSRKNDIMGASNNPMSDNNEHKSIRKAQLSNANDRELTVCGMIVENTFTSILHMVFVILQDLLGVKKDGKSTMQSMSTPPSANAASSHELMDEIKNDDLTNDDNNDDDGSETPNTTIVKNDTKKIPEWARISQSRNGSVINAHFDSRFWAVMHYILHHFISNKWFSLTSIESISMPMLFLSGLKDELVPPKQMKALYQRAKSSAKNSLIVFQSYPRGDHNSTWQRAGESYYEHLSAFMLSALDF